MPKESSIRNSQPSSVGSNAANIKITKEAVSSLLSFFSIMYIIILAASISYNIGYFKYINPQIVDLMALDDYVDDTIHNIWFFLVGALLFFSSSLAFIK